jgi:hypothetical protein
MGRSFGETEQITETRIFSCSCCKTVIDTTVTGMAFPAHAHLRKPSMLRISESDTWLAKMALGIKP